MCRYLGALIAVEQKNLAPAVLWSRRRRLQMEEPFSLLFAMEGLTQARLDYAKGNYADAAHVFETLKKRCLKRSLAEIVLKIDILHYGTLYAMNRQENAVTIMQRALAFSETEGYVRPFVNYAELITPVLQSLADKLPDEALTAHIKKIFAACNTTLWRPTVLSKVETPGPENLSLREIEILEWISRGLQNKEIAQKTFISTNTVKSHVRSILAKLSVRTRTQATIKAKQLGIIDMGVGKKNPRLNQISSRSTSSKGKPALIGAGFKGAGQK